MNKIILLSILFFNLITFSLQITYCHNSFECSLTEECKSGICVNACNNKHCGEHAECEPANHQAICVCEENFIGNPLEKCWKMGSDACEPNPCGNFSICVSNDGHRKPYCLCKENYYGKPPNCREGCANDTKCGNNEICIGHKCIDPCEKSPCGENSNCKSENHSKARCSCADGFFPQSNHGCRLIEKKDLKIDFVALEKLLKDPCDGKCGINAYCDEICKCSNGFKGDPHAECLIDKVDKCSSCGPYSNCTIIDNQPNCTCLKGFQGKPPFCHPCNSSCPSGNICVGQKCIQSPCESFCGKSAECGIKSGKIECSCRELNKNPFLECPSSITDDKATSDCRVSLSDIVKIILN